jgi:four helix bundle protein
MQFGHEQRDVYRVSTRYMPWAHQVVKSLTGLDRPTRDQLLRASQSIPLNIAEGKSPKRVHGLAEVYDGVRSLHDSSPRVR